ncbi:MAG: transglutaminase-like cysteine peptidase [Alphaproteobacteria bacterium]
MPSAAAMAVLALALLAAAPTRAVEAPQATPLPVVALPEAARANPFPQVFGTSETAGSSMTAFRRWGGVLERGIHEWLGYGDPCSARFGGKCVTAEWRQLVARLAEKPRRERIDRVNAFFNRIPYVVDASNWGVADYWATPLQFLSRAGDCEDYAIAKYFTLRQLGFAIDEMRIVVLDDTNLRVPHAILVVADGDRLLVLDNQIPDVVDSKRILHYKAIYSINESRWWLHKK